MLPLSLLVGLATGIAAHDRPTYRWAVTIGTGLSLAWGLLIAIGQSRPLLVGGAFALALANHLVGMVFGAGLRGGFDLSTRLVRR